MNLKQQSNTYSGGEGCYVLGEYHTGLTVRGLMKLYLLDAKKRTTAKSYHILEHIVKRHIIPALGSVEIDYLTEADIDDFLRRKREGGNLESAGGLSRKYVNDISSVLNCAFKLVSWDTSAPGEFIDAPHLKPLSEILTLEQTDILTRYLTQNLTRGNAGFLLCLYTGIKLSEVCSLKDSDFDLENDRIHVQRTMQRAGQGDATTITTEDGEVKKRPTFLTTDYPKDYYGNRILKLPENMSARLWLAMRQAPEGAYFLTGKAQRSISPRAYQKRFKKMLLEAGLPLDLNIHMLRNTFAWMWLLRGSDISGLTYVMGYKDVRTTALTYAPLFKNLRIKLPDCAKFLSVSETDK